MRKENTIYYFSELETKVLHLFMIKPMSQLEIIKRRKTVTITRSNTIQSIILTLQRKGCIEPLKPNSMKWHLTILGIAIVKEGKKPKNKRDYQKIYKKYIESIRYKDIYFKDFRYYLKLGNRQYIISIANRFIGDLLRIGIPFIENNKTWYFQRMANYMTLEPHESYVIENHLNGYGINEKGGGKKRDCLSSDYCDVNILVVNCINDNELLQRIRLRLINNEKISKADLKNPYLNVLIPHLSEYITDNIPSTQLMNKVGRVKMANKMSIML